MCKSVTDPFQDFTKQNSGKMLRLGSDNIRRSVLKWFWNPKFQIQVVFKDFYLSKLDVSPLPPKGGSIKVTANVLILVLLR